MKQVSSHIDNLTPGALEIIYRFISVCKDFGLTTQQIKDILEKELIKTKKRRPG